MLARGEVGDCLRQGVAEVRVQRVAAVAGPLAGVDRELHQVGETADVLSAGGRAAGSVRNCSRFAGAIPWAFR
jgi:hypothetical protein